MPCRPLRERPILGTEAPGGLSEGRVGGGHRKATPVQNVQLSRGGEGTPCFTLAAPSDSGPNTCFLPVLTSTFLTSF